jgi:hypothetical protein
MRYPLPFVILSLCLALLFGLPGAALARQSLAVNSESGRPFLVFNIYDEGEVYGNENLHGKEWETIVSG